MDHGHENNPKFLRGRDTHRILALILGHRINWYHRTSAAQKIGKIIKNNKFYSQFYIKLLKKYKGINLRKIPNKNKPLNDCVIFNFTNEKLAKTFVKKLNENNLVTKNVPDAIEWHYAMYWDHIFKLFGLNKSKLKQKLKKSSYILNRSVSLPIFANEKIGKVKNKIKIIKFILDKMLKNE